MGLLESRNLLPFYQMINGILPISNLWLSMPVYLRPLDMYPCIRVLPPESVACVSWPPGPVSLLQDAAAFSGHSIINQHKN